MREWLTVLLALAFAPETAAAQQAPPEQTEAPDLTNTRYDEDWRYLADPAQRTGNWEERFKYIPIDDASYLTTGLEVRVRGESYDDNLWGGAPAPDDSYVWIRAMPYADLHVGPVRAFVQPIAGYAIGVAPAASPVDQTRVDLLQGFADVDFAFGDHSALTLRVGRQMLSLGTERLVGTRYGPNVPLAFDGGRAIVKVDGWTASVFAVRPVAAGTGTFDDRTSVTKSLWGLYANRGGIDLYYLGFRNDDARFATIAGRELRHSLGVRLFGQADRWHWNVEAMAQFGHIANQRIRAWSIGTETGHTFTNVPLKPDITVRFNVIGGDTNANDHTLGTFNALFPKGKYFGELSPIGPYNIVDLHPTITVDLASRLHASLAAMRYWRFATADGVYDIPGNLIRAPQGSRARHIGDELEALIDWQATRQLELSASLSAFRPGDFIRDTGPARTITMLGLEGSFKF